jgi:hypothetical protein
MEKLDLNRRSRSMDLKKANHGLDKVRIVERPGYKNLYLRAFLPAKDGSGISRQLINTDCRVNGAGLTKAKALAKRLDSELTLGTFEWSAWGYVPKVESGTIEAFLEQKRSQISESSIKTQYEAVLKWIDTKEITTEYLVKLIRERSKDHSKNRKTYTMVLTQLARYLGLDDRPIKAIAGKYRPRPIDSSELPSDSRIVEIWESIGDSWKWIYGMMATYGLRPHETFKVDVSTENDQLIARVRNDTKTGSRIVLPLPNDWTKLFNLETIVYPDIILEGRDNRRLSERISLKFREKRVPHTPKALRHAYSCRGARLGIGPDVMARLMGHSVTVHCSTYQNALALEAYQEIFKKL